MNDRDADETEPRSMKLPARVEAAGSTDAVLNDLRQDAVPPSPAGVLPDRPDRGWGMTEGGEGMDAWLEREAKALVLAAPMLTVDDADGVLGAGAGLALVAAGRLVAVNDGAGMTLIPAFQVDLAAARVVPVVADVNIALGAYADPWGVASWWVSPSGTLPEGVCPADIAVTQPDLLRRIADDLTER